MLHRFHLCRLAAVATLCAAVALPLQTRAQDKPANADSLHGRVQEPVRYFHLHNQTQNNAGNEVLVALRNLLDPSVKIYLVQSTNTIVIAAPTAQLDLAQQIVSELDVPSRSYRLEYTVTTIDNGQRTGTEHFSNVVVAGQRTDLKQGSKVPVVTGTFKPESAASETQFTYLDVGINLSSTLEEAGGGANLRYKVEESSIAPEQSAAGGNDPVVRQSVIEGVALLPLGKAVLLGGVDIPGSTRHLDVAVTLEPMP